MHKLQKMAFFAVLVFLGSCENASNNGTAPDANPGSAGTVVPIPRQLAESRAIDKTQLSVEVFVGDDVVPLAHNDDFTEWTGNITVPANTQVDLDILWDINNLWLASYERTIGPFTADSSLTISDNEYETTGAFFDQDSDGLSNLQELNAGSDPLDSESPGSTDIDVIIPLISPTDAPTLDGLYDNIWNSAVFQDREGNDLKIDNLMIDLGADRPDQETEFRWGAMHDGTFLYVLVLAENVANATLQADSNKPWRDDNINIYFDGDNSKGSTYDGLNDYHILIPFLSQLQADTTETHTLPLQASNDLITNDIGELLIELPDGTQKFVPTKPLVANRSTVFDLGQSDVIPRAELGFNSATPPDDTVGFANCKCTSGQHTYELKFDINKLDITIGRAFGFEVQIDDDNDGAGRDSRYGWIHPSRTTVDTDQTWISPSFMGTAILE